MSSVLDLNDTEVSRAENDQTQVDMIWHNMYAPSTFVTWRKQSTRSIEQLLIDFTTLVDKGVFGVISLSVSKASFVAVVGCEKSWEEIQERVSEATR